MLTTTECLSWWPESTTSSPDSTWNVFFKMHFGKLYEGMLATSLGPLDVALGEIVLALLRGGVYGAGFLIVMQLFGLNLSWTAILAANRNDACRSRA